jgi:hypothetical protein
MGGAVDRSCMSSAVDMGYSSVVGANPAIPSMEITIENKETKLILTDKGLDNPNFVDLILYHNTEHYTLEISVDTESLAGAVNAFVEKRRLALERDKLYRER